MHVWNDENPRVTQKFPSSLEIKSRLGKILGSVILPETLNGVSYMQFLAKNLQDFLEEVSPFHRNKIIFQ